MAELSRRHLVVSGLAGAGANLLPGAINEANAATSIRYNLASANGQVMLKKYAQAVKLMMALPTSDPLSWTFQWYTHAVPTNTTKAAQIGAIFGPNPSPNKTLATAMWNTCQAHFKPGEQYFSLAPDVCLLIRGDHSRGAEGSRVHVAVLELFGACRLCGAEAIPFAE